MKNKVVAKGDWNEQDHPRASDGKFGSGGGSSSGDSSPKPAASDGGKDSPKGRRAELQSWAEKSRAGSEAVAAIMEASGEYPKFDKASAAAEKVSAKFTSGKSSSDDLKKAIQSSHAAIKEHFAGLIERVKAEGDADIVEDFASAQKHFESHLAGLESHLSEAADRLQSLRNWEKDNPAPEQQHHSAMTDTDIEAHDARHERAYARWEKRKERAEEQLSAAETDYESAWAEYEEDLGETINEHVNSFDDAAREWSDSLEADADKADAELEGLDEEEAKKKLKRIQAARIKAIEAIVKREWHEGDQPRAEDGKFGSGGGKPKETESDPKPAGKKPKFEDSESADQWASQNVKMREPATESEAKAGDWYRHKGDREMNGALRRQGILNYLFGPRGQAKEGIQNMDTLIGKSSLGEDATVHRGIAFTGDPRKVFKAGAEVSDNGYWSTSLHRPVAEKFASTIDGEKTPVLFEIALPKGHNAYHMPRVEGKYDEAELVLPRGGKFRVESIQEADGKGTQIGRPHVVVKLVPIAKGEKKCHGSSATNRILKSTAKGSPVRQAKLLTSFKQTGLKKTQTKQRYGSSQRSLQAMVSLMKNSLRPSKKKDC